MGQLDKINKVLDIEKMQKVQDDFSELTGLAAVLLTVDGEVVTESSHFTEICRCYTRMSPIGYGRCEKCIRDLIRQVKEKRDTVICSCHIGLVNYGIPLFWGNEVAAVVYGGQVLIDDPDIEQFKQMAHEMDIDSRRFIRSAAKLRIITKQELEKTIYYIKSILGTMVDMAEARYQTMETETEAKKVAQMKSDFLANMSHEIRTPMNAVIGMAEMALRESMSGEAREYVRQIQTSGKALLSLINDILDFSKIQAGKMRIQEEPYSITELSLEIMNMLQAKSSNSKVELILNINPALPVKLYGDGNRIRQIMVNILNNAVKFTHKGAIVMDVDFQTEDEENLTLKIDIRDTGIGIKEKDLGGIFESFQQVDSKRNRNIEGTGLGLAITQDFVHMMNGTISVESHYGKGTAFSVRLPQKVAIADNSIRVASPEDNIVYIMLHEGHLQRALHDILDTLGVVYKDVDSEGDVPESDERKNRFLFTEEKLCRQETVNYAAANDSVTVVVLADYYSTLKSAQSNIWVVKRPFSTNLVAGILNGESLHIGGDADNMAISFIAPDAHVLMVDDNLINLQVDVGLLAPLEMHIDTAQNGKEAIDLIAENKYDLIFMDHMMPGMDGVETTHIIRRFYENYNDVPIIALTGNVADGIENEFIREGMNDFVPKPVEVKVLMDKLRKWLPPDKLIKQQKNIMPKEMESTAVDLSASLQTPAGGEEEKAKERAESPVPGLDIAGAIEMLQSEELYKIILDSFYQAIPERISQFREMTEQNDTETYLIEIHALKSTAKQVGAMELGDEAAYLYELAKQGDWDEVFGRTPDFLEKFAKLGEDLKKYLKNS